MRGARNIIAHCNIATGIHGNRAHPTMVFVGGVAEHKFRAIHLQTGETLWEGELPRAGLAAPMTYEVDGRQYVVIAAGGHAYLTDQTGDFLVAFALP